MGILDILNEINNVRGSAKLDVLKSHSDNEILSRVCQMTYSKQITFGISKKTFPVVSSHTGECSLEKALTFMMEKFATRVFTGGDAINRLSEILSELSESDSEVVKRIMFGDLDVGINVSTINKVWAGLIKEQPQMLSSPENPKLIEKILKGGNAFAELKADGARGFGDVTGLSDEDGIHFFTRSSNEYLCLERIKKAIDQMQCVGWVIDGEFVVRAEEAPEIDVMASLMGDIEEVELSKSDKYKTVFDREAGNGIMNKSLKNTITPEEANRVVYQVWDITPRDVYYGLAPCLSHMTQEYRRNILIDFLSQIDDDCIQIIDSTPVKTLEDVRRVYQGYVKDGFEGIILKDGNSLWEDKRSKSFVKFKEKYPFDLEIVEVYEHDKDPNKVGGFVMVSACGTIKTRGGSGLTDTTTIKVYEGNSGWNRNQHLYEHHKDKAGNFIELPIPIEDRDVLDREKLMKMHKDGMLVGMIVECEVNAPTTSKTRKAGEPEFSFFLPIIKKLRYDKDKANRYEDVFVIDGE
ncbi:DNA ligase [Aeromonas phage ZPAH1]|nr:DNA ligase [Aeromonas phage Aswh_1]QQG34007.1 DNA ligase [Aeromonas phage ZPAH1]